MRKRELTKMRKRELKKMRKREYNFFQMRLLKRKLAKMIENGELGVVSILESEDK